MITKELFSKFLQGECTGEERRLVVSYLEKYPEAIEWLMPEEEFLNTEMEAELSPEIKERITQKVRKNTYDKPGVYQIGKRLLVAASFILVVVLAWKFIIDNNYSSLAESKPFIRKDTIWKQFAAAAATGLQVILPDSSVIELSPNSTLQYNNLFQVNGKRMVYLRGEAYFKVAKDKTKPFMVYTGDITTTALGTSFTIHAFDDQNIISVLLHTGKVVVQSADSINKKLMKDMYLLPGDELFYNKQTYLASIRSQKDIKHNTAKQKAEKATIYKPDWYKFNDQELSTVLDQLSFYYQVNINYNEGDIRNCYISATFSNSDSLETILQDIALLNNLTIDRRNDQYIIRKMKP